MIGSPAKFPRSALRVRLRSSPAMPPAPSNRQSNNPGDRRWARGVFPDSARDCSDAVVRGPRFGVQGSDDANGAGSGAGGNGAGGNDGGHGGGSDGGHGGGAANGGHSNGANSGSIHGLAEFPPIGLQLQVVARDTQRSADGSISVAFVVVGDDGFDPSSLIGINQHWSIAIVGTERRG